MLLSRPCSAVFDAEYAEPGFQTASFPLHCLYKLSCEGLVGLVECFELEAAVAEDKELGCLAVRHRLPTQHCASTEDLQQSFSLQTIYK